MFGGRFELGERGSSWLDATGDESTVEDGEVKGAEPSGSAISSISVMPDGISFARSWSESWDCGSRIDSISIPHFVAKPVRPGESEATITIRKPTMTPRRTYLEPKPGLAILPLLPQQVTDSIPLV